MNSSTINSIVMLVIFTICISTLFAQFHGGAGTESDPWQVSTAQELSNLRNYIGPDDSDKYYIQTTDVDLSVYPYNQGEGWLPIGSFISFTDFSDGFYGHYNGNNHTIDNLFISRPDVGFQGLFGLLCGTVNNLGVTNANVTGGSAGLLSCTLANGSVSNCFSTGIVIGTNHHAGGLIGMGGFSSISCSFSTASVTSAFNTGGFIGDVVNLLINDCFSTGNVNGNNDDCTGGFTGWASTSVFTNCFSIGHVSGGGTEGDIGGFVGYNDESTFTSCYWNTQTSGQPSSPGALGRTTDDLTYPYATNTYLNWDFVSVWGADVSGQYNNGYPYLLNCTSVDNEDHLLTASIKLFLFNYPNPFNQSTSISFVAPKSGEADLSIFNVKGQRVKFLHRGSILAGHHSLVWDCKDESGYRLPAGVYFAKIELNGITETRKMTIVK